jgi:2-dehydro-3-deoxyphosphogluconate aldolase/(4S)-4-hydroxy-2-oxoglutarate aldolase
MSKFNRIEVLIQLKDQGILPLFYHGDMPIATEILRACYRGGIRIIEFTNRGNFAHEIFGELVKLTQKEMPDLILGIGSVQDAPTASLYMQMGAAFIVTPVWREDIAKVCNRRKIPFIPGCGSASEIAMAEEWGCEVVKLFPANIYGPSFIKSLRGPQPWTSIMPSGGVSTDEEDLKAWIRAGSYCLGMGSNLISDKIVQEQNWNKLESEIRLLLSRIQKIRASE